MPETVNTQVADDMIAHQHLVERLKEGNARKAVRFLEREVYPDVTKQVAAAVKAVKASGTGTIKLKVLARSLASVNRLLAEGLRSVKNSVVIPDLLDAGLMETEALVNIVDSALPTAVPHSMQAISFGQVRKIIAVEPYRGAVLNKWWQSLTRAAQRDMVRAIRIGLIEGETTKQIVARVRGSVSGGTGVYGTTNNVVRTHVNTATNHVMAQTREQTYAENRKTVSSVQWVATLDTRTSLICISLDGSTYRINEGPRPPAHFNCRSTTVPVISSYERFGLKDPAPSTRASMDGQVSSQVTYKEWFSRQSKARQREVLGPARFELFEQGRVSVDKFVNQRRRVLTVGQLREKAGFATK